jgi:hypothetical protein
MNLKGSKTHDNLKAAFAGESQANRRYLYFASKADVEGQNDIAAVFRSTARLPGFLTVWLVQPLSACLARCSTIRTVGWGCRGHTTMPLTAILVSATLPRSYYP